MWCFGFSPGNDAGPDSNITQPGALPASDNELKVLTTWINDRKGGVLAMGDHDYLGASMCHRIPRIRSMRRWTNAQNVPPIGGITDPDTALRHDTNQPATFAQINSGALIPFDNQEDAVPQKIEWVPWISQHVSVFRVIERPHPVLCHPTWRTGSRLRRSSTSASCSTSSPRTSRTSGSRSTAATRASSS